MGLIVAEVLLQIACAYHAYRNGNAQPWLFIILLFPLVGSIVYIVAVVLPGFRHTSQAQQLATGVRKLIDPDRDLRERLQEADLVDSADAKRGLAEELMRRGDFPAAVRLLEGAATGIQADDPALLYVLARARFGAMDFVGTQKTLDELREANPNWQSGDAHLLYARFGRSGPRPGGTRGMRGSGEVLRGRGSEMPAGDVLTKDGASRRRSSGLSSGREIGRARQQIPTPNAARMVRASKAQFGQLKDNGTQALARHVLCMTGAVSL